MIQRFIKVNRDASSAFDRLLPARFVVDGNRHFLDEVVPRYLAPKARVVDVGGGRHPVVQVATKRQLGLTVTGLDIEEGEVVGGSEVLVR